MSSEILFRYERVDPTTWAYLSSLLTLAIYFKFGRFWSMRNLDLLGLISLAPGLLLVKYGLDYAGIVTSAGLIENIGYILLFSIQGMFLLRLLLDCSMVRRPLLEPNLMVGGMTFLAIALLGFQMANVIIGKPSQMDLAGSRRAAELRSFEASPDELSSLETHGPGFPLLYLLPHISTQQILAETAQEGESSKSPGQIRTVHSVTARVVAIISHTMIVIGMVLIGLRHFDSVKAGVAAATLYLLLPYTAMWTGSVTHALPGALLVWAVVVYRYPMLAGVMLGLAFGTIYYPLFLLPLWMSFYRQRGLVRFLLGFAIAVAALIITLVFTSIDFAMFAERMQQMFGVRFPIGKEVSGAWKYWNDDYRGPILLTFVLMSLALAILPAQKNLGTLMSCSAALMLATQFWHAHSGGLALAWYLPLLVLTIFRPNLEDRVAWAVLDMGGNGRQKKKERLVVQAT